MNISVERVEEIFADRSRYNTGSWVRHSENTALAATTIAAAVKMDDELAYCMGLLHDIGRSFTQGQFLHIARGYDFMKGEGAGDIARICLTHSFPLQILESYVGKIDIDEVQCEKYRELLMEMQYDGYDRLIQLCDAVSTEDGFVIPEKKFVRSVFKYGFNEYTIPKWEKTLSIKHDFDNMLGVDVIACLHARYPALII